MVNDNPVSVRPMHNDECVLWGALRTRLWPDCLEPENEAEYAAFLDGTSAIQIVFLAFADGEAVAFAEISERNVVDGCAPGPAAYLEGWYVAPASRGQGVGARLVAAAKAWAVDKAYAWFASDVEPDNLASQKAHLALGFEESGRAINYRLKLAK